MVQIYCLIDPQTNNPFYVGATRCLLKNRLSGHLSDSKLMRGGPIFNSRCDKINEIVDRNERPIIKLLRKVNEVDVDKYESFYYRKMVRKGYVLFQSETKFVYCKTAKSRMANEKNKIK